MPGPVPQLWEHEAFQRAERGDACYSPAMRSWSRSFRKRALWNRYVLYWREAKP